MISWGCVNIGDKLLWVVDEFDGHSEVLGEVISKHPDHCIVKASDMNLWLDKDTEHMFTRIQ